MLTTPLSKSTAGPNKLRFQGPPSVALKRYLQASESSSDLPLDSVHLSETATAAPAKTSGLSKAAQFVGLGVALVAAMGAVGCSGGTTQQPEATVSVEQETSPAEEQFLTTLKDSTSTEQRQAEPKAETVSSQLEREAKSVVEEVKKAGQEVKRVREDLRGADTQEVGRVLSREGKALGETVVEEMENEVQKTVKDVQKVGQEVKRVRENLRGKSGKEVTQELGREGKKLGQKIGKDAEKFGKDVGNTAKKLWKGLRGKKRDK